MILTALQILSSNAIFISVYFLKYRYFFRQRPQRYLYGRVKISGGSRPSGKGAGGCGHPDPEIRGRGAASKKIFSHFGLKIRGGGSSPGSATENPREGIQGKPWVGVCRQGLHSLKMKIDTPV